MASRRKLKKTINYIASELFAECLYQKQNLDTAGAEKADGLAVDVLKLHREFISRISHTEPGNVKGFYKKLYADFDAQAEKVLDGLKALGK